MYSNNLSHSHTISVYTISSVCILQIGWCRAITSPTITLFQCTLSTVCTVDLVVYRNNLSHSHTSSVYTKYCVSITDPVVYSNNLSHSHTIPRISNGSAKTGLTSLYSLSRYVKIFSLLATYSKFLKDIDWIIKTSQHSLYSFKI